MDYNEKVQYLKSYRDKCDRIEFIDIQMMGLKAVSYGPAIGGHRSIEQYLAEKQYLYIELDEIENVINTIEDITARTIVGYKYLQYLTFEEISKKVKYSKSSVRDYHRKGINMLKI